MEIRPRIKPDYVKCLKANPSWTIPIITEIATTLEGVYEIPQVVGQRRNK